MGRPREKLKHGTAYAYQGRGCRCKVCKRAHTDLAREYRANKKKALADEARAVERNSASNE